MTSYRFGKHPAKHDYRTLRLKDYVSSGLAPPPASYDVLGRVYKNLKITDPAALFPLDGNRNFSDCTIAALAHAETVFRGLARQRRVMSEKQVLKLYWHLTGGVDSGLVELD